MAKPPRATAADRRRGDDPVEVTVESLGSRGDGVARVDRGMAFVPFALPGDRLQVRIEGRRGEGFEARPVAALSEAARAVPPCPHFGRCGGCQLQHVLPEQYAAWLREQILTPLRRRGFHAIEVRQPLITPPASRRRIRLGFERSGKGIRLGFRARASPRIVDVVVCPVVLPAIEALLAPLRDLLTRLELAAAGGEVQITHTTRGADLILQTEDEPSLADRELLAAFAADHDLARLCWRHGAPVPPEPVVVRRQPVIEFDGVEVELPAGAFLQATRDSEAALRAAVRAALGDAARVADLFAGCGTFALPLAREGRHVLAVEIDAPMLEAVARAARAAGLEGRIRTVRRDLERQPLATAELAGLDAAVLDPPRAGARAQAAALAGSGVPRIAMVSCNPRTFARDARILADGGFELLWVQPVDPFLWSAELELAAAFARPGRP